MGTNVQVCWEKFCRYWDVEPKLRTDGTRPLPPGRGRGRRPVRREHDRRRRDHGLHHGRLATSRCGDQRRHWTRCSHAGGPDVPIHVDGASGGFVAPFLQPDLEWDFRVPRVASINTSGHKYGLVYPGRRLDHLARRGAPARGPHLQGQLPRRRDADVRAELLKARRAGRRAVLQLPRLGHDGYQRVQQTCPGHRAPPVRRDRASWARSSCCPTDPTCRSSRSGCATTSPGTRCSTSPSGCGCAAGRCPPTRSPRT